MLSLASVSCLVWDLTGSQLPRIKVWAIFDTKPALNHWSISRHRLDWFTFMQILSFQTGFSRFLALGIGPHLLKQSVPAGCDSFNSLPPCFLSCDISSSPGGLQMIHQADIVKSYPGEPHTNIRFLNWHQSYHRTCFFRAENRIGRTFVHACVWALNSSWDWLRSTSLFFWDCRISMWWHLLGLNPVLLHTKPKLYHGANQALS